MSDTAFAPATRQDTARAVLDTLLSRQSHYGLTEPAPSDDELDLILDTALRAPDHAQLRPWRYVLIRDEARAELAEVLIELARAREPNLEPDHLQALRDGAHAAPLLIAVGAAVRTDTGIPEVEQILSTGAATMNLLNAIHALGYGAFWITGDISADPALPRALDFEPGDRLLGFVMVGTPLSNDAPRPRPARANHVREWLGRSSI